MYMNPMFMQYCAQPFDDEQYLFEPLIDGQRLQLTMFGDKVGLYTRNHNDVTRQYPELHNVPLKSPSDIVLDGEVACVNPNTRQFDYNLLQQRFRLKRLPMIREAKLIIPVAYYVFDILYYNGSDLRNTPLYQRKQLLNEIIEDNAYYRKMIYWEEAGNEMFQFSKRFELEGVACKRRDSAYREGRCDDSWLKVLNSEYKRLKQAE